MLEIPHLMRTKKRAEQLFCRKQILANKINTQHGPAQNAAGSLRLTTLMSFIMILLTLREELKLLAATSAGAGTAIICKSISHLQMKR